MSDLEALKKTLRQQQPYLKSLVELKHSTREAVDNFGECFWEVVAEYLQAGLDGANVAFYLYREDGPELSVVVSGRTFFSEFRLFYTSQGVALHWDASLNGGKLSELGFVMGDPSFSLGGAYALNLWWVKPLEDLPEAILEICLDPQSFLYRTEGIGEWSLADFHMSQRVREVFGFGADE